ncbi:MAG TPA: hypothetical protein VFL85_00285 [Candidatus Saccharimonadales bacterium]|nr:hypothetical protein [Candidatus Saccharimonadales bacterium]
MALDITSENSAPVLSQHLLLSVAEQLKLPLLQIARQAELARMTDRPADAERIQTTADMALHLLDSYVLSVQLATEEQALFETEPVTISSVLYDVGTQLQPIAKAYDVRLELNMAGKYGPVMAHRKGLQSALVSLGYALIEALPAADRPQLKLQLATHRCRYGVVAGLYCEAEEISTEALRLGRQLYGRARQPLTGLSSGSGAGVFVADALLHAMSSQLTVSRHNRLRGLGAVLQPNPQMQLV